MPTACPAMGTCFWFARSEDSNRATAPQRRAQQSSGLLVSPRESPRGMRRLAGPCGGSSLTESVGLLFCCYSPGRRVGASSGTRTARARRPLRRAKRLLRSYAGVCLQGLVIALACIIFSALSTSAPTVGAGSSAITAVWSYVGTLAFNLLVLVGAVKGCDRIVKEIMGL